MAKSLSKEILILLNVMGCLNLVRFQLLARFTYVSYQGLAYLSGILTVIFITLAWT